MRVGVDAVDCSILASLATPPVAVADEEHLLLRKVVQARQVLVWCLS